MVQAKVDNVVGCVLAAHDGSESSAAALATAVRLAAALRCKVVVIRAWDLMNAPTPETKELGYIPPLEDYESAVQSALDSDVAKIQRHHPEVEIRTEVVHGNPAECLIEASDGAGYLVVGRRGLGGFKGLLLGSVSEKLVRHARCPVVIDGGATAEGRSEGDVLSAALASELKLD